MKNTLISTTIALVLTTCITGFTAKPNDISIQTPQQLAQSPLTVTMLARYESGQYGVSAAEILDYHAQSKSIFVVNAKSGQVDILDASIISTVQATKSPLALNNLTKKSTLNLALDLNLTRLGSVNSIAIYSNLLAVAIERGDSKGNPVQDHGFIGFYRLDNTGKATYLHAVEVGYLPDNVVFTHDGSKVIVANEGEPNDDYTVDPEGSISIININNNVPVKQAINISFNEFNTQSARHHELPKGVKINGPKSSVSQDLEPEYIAISHDNSQAFVSLQENNAIAVIDLKSQRVERIVDLGSKDYGLAKNAIDASDKDGKVNIQTYPGVYGLYQPDTIATYSINGVDFIVTANEGDARDYAGFSEETRAGKLTLDKNHPQFDAIQDKTQLGRLKVTTSIGDTDNDGDIDRIYSFGSRSFSIWDAQGKQVFDSGNDFDRITADRLGINFNNNNRKNKGDNRSDDKGAEPEALALGAIDGRKYAFIGLERTSGFMIYDITEPRQAYFVDYIVNRDFAPKFEVKDGVVTKGDPSAVGDLGPEGMKFIAANESPNGKPLLFIANEVSGTTVVYQLQN
ncbi:Alkaline phosphatase [Moritella sp. JT01]|uniref:choice-of-anchor I family protein n=1 Tax=Moritella sp. JT01 TaxID=756698 RepID=UPI00079BA631|nr:choice-of-anchor I family protein [Moritella sp. JT01]KXO12734.1 Alkaline phosphatase [Moritella sp. JT01]